jgi:excisionase family DNA binding protein
MASGGKFQPAKIDVGGSKDLNDAGLTPLREMVADGMVHVAEAARFLGIGKSLLYQMMEQGELAYAKIHGRRCIPRRALVELAARRVVIREAK